MSFEDILEALPQLTVEQREVLIDLLSESGDEDETVELLPWQRELLDERLAAAEADPKRGSPWPEVLARLMGKD